MSEIKEGYVVCWAAKNQPHELSERKAHCGEGLSTRAIANSWVQAMNSKHPNIEHWAEWTTTEIQQRGTRQA